LPKRLVVGGPFVPCVTVPHQVVAAARVAAGYAATAAVALVACAALVACGMPPELRPRPGSSVPYPPSMPPSPSSATTTSPDLLPPGETGSPGPSFAEEVAVPCRGTPTGNEVLALVRRTGGLLAGAGSVTATKGPLCAGSWQYTVFAVPNKEPLLVVSRGTPDDLVMVTAGTDICSIEVRTEAPAGILSAALCPAPGS
jgi:hypothetical protein